MNDCAPAGVCLPATHVVETAPCPADGCTFEASATTRHKAVVALADHVFIAHQKQLTWLPTEFPDVMVKNDDAAHG
jgi:hypothetical protein